MFILIIFFLFVKDIEASSKNADGLFESSDEKSAEEIRNQNIKNAYNEISHTLKGLYPDRLFFLKDKSSKEILIFQFKDYLSRIQYVQFFPVSESDTDKKEIFFIAFKNYIKDLLLQSRSNLYNKNVLELYDFLLVHKNYILENIEKAESLYSHFSDQGRISIFFDPSLKDYSQCAFEKVFQESNSFIEDSQFYWNKDYQMFFYLKLKENSDIIKFFKENNTKAYFKDYFFIFFKDILKDQYIDNIDNISFEKVEKTVYDRIKNLIKQNAFLIPLNREKVLIWDENVIDKKISLDLFDFVYENNSLRITIGSKNTFINSICTAVLEDIIQEKNADNIDVWKVSLNFNVLSQEIIDYMNNINSFDFVKNSFSYLRYNNHSFDTLRFESEEEKNAIQSCYKNWEDLSLFLNKKAPKNVKIKDSSGNPISLSSYPSFLEKKIDESGKKFLFYFNF